VCKLEPAFVAVPSLLIVMATLKGLSKGVEYLEENLVREAMDCCAWRHMIVIMIVAISTWGR